MKKSIIMLVLIFCLSLTAYANSAVSSADSIVTIYDQGNTGMCGTYAITTAMEMTLNLHGYDVPSGGFNTQWLYDKTKIINADGTFSGAKPETIMSAVNKYGMLPNYANDYTAEQQIIEAKKYRPDSYTMLPANLDDFKQSLSANNVLMIAIKYRENDWNDGNAYIAPNGEVANGYHAVTLIGYDDAMSYGGHTGFFVGVNSWGEQWGDNGKFYLSYDCVDEVYYGYQLNMKSKTTQKPMQKTMHGRIVIIKATK